MITLTHYLVLSAVLFAISVAGIFLNRKNIIVLLMAIELMLLAVNMNFIAFSHYLGDLSGMSNSPRTPDIPETNSASFGNQYELHWGYGT